MTKPVAILLAFILAAGIFLRVYPSAGFKEVGFDEHVYATYAKAAALYGLTNYSALVDEFVAIQAKQHDALVPPTRVAFVVPAALLVRAGVEPLRAVRMVSAAAAILLLLTTAAIGYRCGKPWQMLAATALMAVAPLQIALAQRSLGDGYFALWATLSAWFFFEALFATANGAPGGQDRQSHRWLFAFGISFFLLVLTKETAAFVCIAFVAVAICFAVTRVAPLNWKLLGVMGAAGVAGVIVIASLLGGFVEFFAFYRGYAAKSAAIPYVIKFQDGAWYRYLVDFTMLSPLVVVLALMRAGKIDNQSRADLFWALFLLFSFIGMSSVRYGMSLRFAAFWDVPLRWLAASGVVILTERIATRWRAVALSAALLLMVIVDLAQYQRFFIKAEIYDPVSAHLLRASKLVK